MKWYGSIENRIEERRKGLEPQVGMGVTEYMYSDRNAYEIIEVKDDKNFKMRRYDVKHYGSYGEDNWELISNPNGYVYEMTYRYDAWYEKKTYTKELIEEIERKNGYILLDEKTYNKAMTKGIAYKYNKMNIVIGKADYYYDWSF